MPRLAPYYLCALCILSTFISLASSFSVTPVKWGQQRSSLLNCNPRSRKVAFGSLRMDVENPVSKSLPTLKSVEEAYERIRDKINVTPVLTSQALDKRAGRNLFFKTENFQKVGAFKFRGATNAVCRYIESGGKGPLVTHSSGNHAQALALASKQAGLEAYIVMPSNASPVKVEAVKEYGANVVMCEPILQARDDTANEVMAEHPGSAFIPPYDDVDIISGAGTTGLEFLSQIEGGKLDALIVPVGGGGLLSGVCVAAKGVQPDIRIFAAEPLGADDAARSMRSGKMIEQTDPNTIADGLLTSMGDLTWPIIRDNVEEVLVVSEEEIVAAMRLVWMRMKIVIEPSAAVSVAAVLSERFQSMEGMGRVGVVLSGGNVDLDNLPW